jgi:spore coat polysaccharide biosynthesis protein SpsF
MPPTDDPTEHLSPQAALWRGAFGDEYADRNPADPARLAQMTRHWSKVLRCTEGEPPQSILEVGPNVGLNLRALARVTIAELWAVEPNAKARQVLVSEGVIADERVLDGVAAKIDLPDGAVDLAFTSGVLIHIHPRDLLASCREIHRVSRRYVACVEYFSDREEEVPYRGNREALFKRDFGGFWLDNFPDLRVLDYGFAWRRATGLDNSTWWVFEKRA